MKKAIIPQVATGMFFSLKSYVEETTGHVFAAKQYTDSLKKENDSFIFSELPSYAEAYVEQKFVHENKRDDPRIGRYHLLDYPLFDIYQENNDGEMLYKFSQEFEQYIIKEKLEEEYTQFSDEFARRKAIEWCEEHGYECVLKSESIDEMPESIKALYTESMLKILRDMEEWRASKENSDKESMQKEQD